MHTVRAAAPKLQSLQVLRALAALLVVMFHTQVTLASKFDHRFAFGLFNDGNRGVDLFFVLSGFIITYVHFADLSVPARAASYAYNRLARIFPLVWIVTALTVLSAAWGANNSGVSITPWNVISTAFLLPNASGALVDVMWSLKCEIFFYIVFLAAIFRREAGVAIAVVWQATIAILAVLNVDVTHTWYGLYLQPINLEFGIGIICALVYRSRSDWNVMTASAQRLIFLVGLAGFLVAGLLKSHIPGQLDGLAGILVFGTSAGIIVTSLVILETNGHARMNRTLAAIGGASYAIYLVHYQIIVHFLAAASRFRSVPKNDLLGLGAAAAGVAVGLVLDRFGDQPIQRALRRAKRQLFRSAAPFSGKEAAAVTVLEQAPG